MTTIFTGVTFHTLKKTLNAIVTDDTDGLEAKCIMRKYFDEESTDENYVDDLEIAGIGLASERTEGAEIATGTIREGYMTRYMVRNFGVKTIVTEEAMEDNKYPQAYKLMKRNKRAMWKTVDIDSALVLVRATDTNYVGGDGVPLASASHPLANGGTFSNLMTTPMTPSRVAYLVGKTQLGKLPSQDGVIEGYLPERILCPLDQEPTWQGILLSENAPEPGQFNQINVAYRDKIEIVANKYWSNTTTNWAIQSDAEDGLKFFWRKKPVGVDWVENSQAIYLYAIKARWSRGWSNARNILFVAA
jgi:hypothetical protein